MAPMIRERVGHTGRLTVPAHDECQRRLGLRVRAGEVELISAGDVLVYRVPADSLLLLLAERPGMRFLARMVRPRQSMLTDVSGPEAGVECVHDLMRPSLIVDCTAAMKQVIAGHRR